MKLYHYTRAGLYHEERGEENQDAVCWNRENGIAVLSLADGVSSCRRGGEGARIAAAVVRDELMKNREAYLQNTAVKRSGSLLSAVIRELENVSREEGILPEEYSSTMSGVLVDENIGKMYYCHLGDSMIMMIKNHTVQLIGRPDTSTDGTVCTTTQDAYEAFSEGIVSLDSVTSIMLCSDGIWREMYKRGHLIPGFRSILVADDIPKLIEYFETHEVIDDIGLIAVKRTITEKKCDDGRESSWLEIY